MRQQSNFYSSATNARALSPNTGIINRQKAHKTSTFPNLSDRVLQLSQKINALHSTIERSKQEKIGDTYKKAQCLEQMLTHTQTEMDQHLNVHLKAKVNTVYQFVMDREGGLTAQRAEQLRKRRQELGKLEREMNEKLSLIGRQRELMSNRVHQAIDESVLSVQSDLQQETHNRQQSLSQLRDQLSQDFPSLQRLIQEEQSERQAQDMATQAAIDTGCDRLNDEVDCERAAREGNEETMIETFKEMICKIKGEIDQERIAREDADETLLRLLEETCAKLQSSTQYQTNGGSRF